MPESFDPQAFPGVEAGIRPALELYTALALLDGEMPRAWLRCRRAALRYVEAGRRGGLRPGGVSRLLETAAARWTADAAPAAVRTELRRRIPFWVGTVYGLRWQVERPTPTGTPTEHLRAALRQAIARAERARARSRALCARAAQVVANGRAGIREPRCRE